MTLIKVERVTTIVDGNTKRGEVRVGCTNPSKENCNQWETMSSENQRVKGKSLER